jgi:ABC-type lipoprotein export system ATPase subunit
LFFDLRDKFGQTFVIVTHDPELAKITDETIYLRDGKRADGDNVEFAPTDVGQNGEKSPVIVG